MVGEMVTIVNRTSKVLEVVQGGRVKKLQPGPNHVTADWIRFAKQQHPRFGTFDPSGLDGQYLVGVQGMDDCSMIEPGKEHLGPDRFDRSQMDENAQQAVAVPSGISTPTRRMPGEMSPLPDDAVFRVDN